VLWNACDDMRQTKLRLIKTTFSARDWIMFRRQGFPKRGIENTPTFFDGCRNVAHGRAFASH
jgi:hypothetical protein